jgi:hypothetical protein
MEHLEAADLESLVIGFTRALGVAPNDQIRRYIAEGQGTIPDGACLLAWDANSVHGYVFDTTNATCIRGASARLRGIDDELLRGGRLGVSAEQILYSGGGSGMAVMSQARAEASEAILHRVFAEKTLVGTCTTAVVKLGEGEESFRGKIEEVFRTLSHNRFLSSPDAEPVVPFFAERCRVCGRRAASRLAARIAAPAGRLECEPCYQRIQTGSQSRRFEREPSDFQDIADASEGGFYAVVYADGNGVGRLLSGLRKPIEYASISRAIDHLLGTAVRDLAKRYDLASVEEEDEGEPALRRRRAGRYQLPICGGDDLVAILPGKVAVPFARDLLKAIQEGADASPILRGACLGAGAGVAISHVKFPVRHLLSEAESLLKLAKQRVYKDQGKVRSALSFAVITDGSPRAESMKLGRLELLDSLERGEPGAVLLSGRPYSLDELESFSHRFRAFRGTSLGKSQLYALLRSAHGGPAQLRSQILYQIGRRQEWRTLVEALSTAKEGLLDNADACVEAVVPRYGGRPVFDIADMLDLYDHWQEATKVGES